MEAQVSQFVQKITNELFDHGIETWDPNDGPMIAGTGKPRGQAHNIGGAKFFFTRNWKRQDDSPSGSQVVFNNENFKKAVTGLQASLYTFSRAKLDENNQPINLASGRGLERTCQGLMLYIHAGTESAARAAAELIKERCPMIASDICLLSDVQNILLDKNVLIHKNGEYCLKEVMHRNYRNELEEVNIKACVFIPVPSGAAGSAAIWTYKSKDTRALAQSYASGQTVDQEGLPF